LPVVCFVDEEDPEGESADYLERIVLEVLSSGKAWISTARLGHDRPVVRACITNYRTEAGDVLALIQTLNEARQRVRLH
jgi:aromatic-L-amino-acid/L-tryptophan decarboxylase